MQSHISCMWAIFWNVILHMSFQIACLNSHISRISCMCAIFPNVILHMSLSSQFACLNRGKVTQVACAIFLRVSVHISLQIACLNICGDIFQLWFSNRLFEQMQSHISCMWAIFWNVCFHMFPHIACLKRCKVTLVAYLSFLRLCVFTCALKSPAWTDAKSQ